MLWHKWMNSTSLSLKPCKMHYGARCSLFSVAKLFTVILLCFGSLLYNYIFANRTMNISSWPKGILRNFNSCSDEWPRKRSWCHKPFGRLSKDELGLRSRDGLILTCSRSSCRPTRSAKTDWKSYGSAWGGLANCLTRTSFSVETSSDWMWDPICIPRKMSTVESWWAGPLTYTPFEDLGMLPKLSWK